MRFRTSLSAACVMIAAVLCASGPAYAAPGATAPGRSEASAPGDTIPKDVTDLLADGSLKAVSTPANDGTAELQAEAVHVVYQFTNGFLDGQHVEASVVPTDTWLAGVARGRVWLGTVVVAKPNGGSARMGAFEEDVDLAAALRDLAPDEILVEDSATGAYYGLEGDTVRPLNPWAELAIAGPTDLPQLQQILSSDRATERQRAADTVTRQFWLRIAGVVGLAALLLAFGSVLIRLRLQAGRSRA